jgi:hypothetical protein
MKENTVILDIERYHELQEFEMAFKNNIFLEVTWKNDFYGFWQKETNEYDGKELAISRLNEVILEREKDIERLKNRPLLQRIFNK